MSGNQSIVKLTVNRHLRSPGEIEQFDKALEELSAEGDLEVKDIQDLFLVFDDDCDNEEVMYGLVHFLEDLDLNTLLERFIEAVPNLSAQAPEWAKVFLYRILNTDNARVMFKKMLSGSNPDSRRIVYEMLSEMSQTESAPLSTYAKTVLGD